MRNKTTEHGPESRNGEMVAGWRDRLIYAKRKAGLSQRALAQAAGLGSTSVRHIEANAGTITLHSLVLLADALGEDVGYLVTGRRPAEFGHRDLSIIRVALMAYADTLQEPWHEEVEALVRQIEAKMGIQNKIAAE